MKKILLLLTSILVIIGCKKSIYPDTLPQPCPKAHHSFKQFLVSSKSQTLIDKTIQLNKMCLNEDINDGAKTDIYNHLGFLYYWKKDYDLSIQYYTDAISKIPTSNMYSHRASAYTAKKKYEKAITDYSWIISKGANTKLLLSAHEKRAQLYLITGNKLGAEADFKIANELKNKIKNQKRNGVIVF